MTEGVAGLGDQAPGSAALGSPLIEAQDAGIVVKHTRVSYLILIPGSTGSYLFLVFTVADGPLADAQVFHFDAIVSTLTWVSADDS